MNGQERIEIAGLDAVGFMKQVDKRTSKYIAISMVEIEEILDKSSPEFALVRKCIIDNMNELRRSILRMTIGDVETGYPGV